MHSRTLISLDVALALMTGLPQNKMCWNATEVHEAGNSTKNDFPASRLPLDLTYSLHFCSTMAAHDAPSLQKYITNTMEAYLGFQFAS